MQDRRPTAAENAFLSGAALHPQPQIVLEKGSAMPAMRAIDLLCPIGRGQRGLIVSPPGMGKTTILKQICAAVAKGYPEIKIFCLLIDERPEEVTDFRRNVNGALYASSLDQSPAHHLEIVNQLMPEAFAAANAGEDVLILLDSLSRLTRVFNSQFSGKGRALSGGLSAGALTIPRQIFGAARNVENQGSITMLATILIDTDSLMDNVIYEEFKGTGNMELLLSKELAFERIFPAIDILKSSTRRSELFYPPEQEALVRQLSRNLVAQDTLRAMKRLLQLFAIYPNNQELLDSLA